MLINRCLSAMSLACYSGLEVLPKEIRKQDSLDGNQG